MEPKATSIQMMMSSKKQWSMFFTDTPAVDRGVKQAQLFVGKESLVSDIYPMMSGMQYVNTSEDNIHRCGAMEKF